MKSYPSDKEIKYAEHFMGGPSLSCFQKHSIEAIVEGQHSLICVPTGNGKTLPAEFAIRYFCREHKKKVIYTSPIKALSNQKYYDFRQKYPDISFGLLTGDIKLNPNADVLIMTAEILQNALFEYHASIRPQSSQGMHLQRVTSILSFDMDFENELACVIHDEVHSIGMQDRGHVWENIFMLLPKHVQNIMLSATLDRPEQFANWCENIHGNKKVYLSTLHNRIVPLKHYSFITCNEGFFKKLKNKELEKEIRDIINQPIEIYGEKKEFNEFNYRKVVKTLSLFRQKDPTTYINRPFVLNKLCQYLVANQMLPCACFILSRKQLEKAAREIVVPLLEDDSKTPYIIRARCESLLREKLTNYQEFIELPEYNSMISLLEKGIATHHSGTLPILKEIVELLFVEGYIKFLFCTETFSCGLNMPIKTTIFTDLHKFDGTDHRLLYGYEYNQASGRAGRRGLDTEGYVIHLNNLFRGESISVSDYRHLLDGKPQKLTSKYKISYHLLLNFMSNHSTHSLFQKELEEDLSIQQDEYNKKLEEYNQLQKVCSLLKTPISVMEGYIHLTNIQKKKKDIERQISSIRETYYTIDSDIKIINQMKEAADCLEKMVQYRQTTTTYLSNKMNKTIALLENEFYIDNGNTILIKGKLAKCFKEVPCLLFSSMIYRGNFTGLSDVDFAMILSCFSAPKMKEETNILTIGGEVERIIDIMREEIEHIRSYEEDNRLNTGENYDLNYQIMDYVKRWMEAESEEDCKIVLQMVGEEDIFLGEFTRSLLKIIAITNEIVCAADKIEDYGLSRKALSISTKIQKYIVTNQSLYI
jgi:superfamily II RNA helicase